MEPEEKLTRRNFLSGVATIGLSSTLGSGLLFTSCSEKGKQVPLHPVEELYIPEQSDRRETNQGSFDRMRRKRHRSSFQLSRCRKRPVYRCTGRSLPGQTGSRETTAEGREKRPYPGRNVLYRFRRLSKSL